MIVSWIIFINSIPEIKIINVLHEFLPPLFNMLSDKQKEVNQSSEKCLKDLLKEIETFFDTFPYDVEVKILEILIDQCKSLQDQTKITAFEWIHLFLQKYKYYLLQNKKMRSPFTKSIHNPGQSSNYINKNSSNLLAVKNWANYNSKDSSISQFSNTGFEAQIFDKSVGDKFNGVGYDTFNSEYPNSITETGERKIPFNLFPKILDLIISSTNHQNSEIKKLSSDSNNELMTILEFYGEFHNTNIKLFEEVLKTYFRTEEKDTTLELVLLWIQKLFKKFHEEMFNTLDSFIDSFTNILSHPNDNLFNSVLDIIGEIAKYKEDYIEIILSKVLEKLSVNKNLLNNKGLIIVKKFCNILQADRVYLTLAEVLLRMKESIFVGKMINILDIFLLTYRETENFKNFLKNVKKNNNLQEKQIFEKLFRTWCLNPVSCIILCLVAEYFELSYYLLIKL